MYWLSLTSTISLFFEYIYVRSQRVFLRFNRSFIRGREIWVTLSIIFRWPTSSPIKSKLGAKKLWVKYLLEVGLLTWDERLGVSTIISSFWLSSKDRIGVLLRRCRQSSICVEDDTSPDMSELRMKNSSEEIWILFIDLIRWRLVVCDLSSNSQEKSSATISLIIWRTLGSSKEVQNHYY